MKQTLFLLCILLGGVAIAAYVLIFSRQDEIAELTDPVVVTETQIPEATTTVEDSAIPSPVPDSQEIAETTQYTSADGFVTFAYPDYFSVKQVDTECSFCPELVLENGDDRLWFGTQPPGSKNRCEQILQHNELPVHDTTVIWYEYRNDQTEECSAAGSIHGFKATVEVGTTIYYIDYLPTLGDVGSQQQLFLQMAQSIVVNQ